MKLFLLLAAVFCYSSSIPVVPANYQVVCQQQSQACKIPDYCGSYSQIEISDILSHSGVSLQDFITLNPALGQLIPSGTLPAKQLVCIAGFWQGLPPIPTPAPNCTTV